MNIVNLQFLTSFIIIAIGFIIKNIKIINVKEGEALAKVILNITLPALILRTFTSIDTTSNSAEISAINNDNLVTDNLPLSILIILTIICIIFSVIIFISGFFLFRRENRNYRGLFMMSVAGYNIGLFAYPLIQGIWGEKGLTYIAMFDLGNTFIIFGLCYIAGYVFSPLHTESVKLKHILKKVLVLVPLWSYIIAIILNLSGYQFNTFPLIITKILNILADSNTSLVYLVLGIYLNFKLHPKNWSIVIKVLSLRYISQILVGLFLYFTIPLPDLFRHIMLIGLIMPVGMAIIPFSVEFGYDKETAGTIVNFSNIISFILIWIISIIL